ncbi:diguanylate cyclase [Neorhizobium sp. NPDC001467]|uniref:sensor domain-containing protein n=1 Tax=Neorhizobium sp. NPDC001467 TaxID=3390595 RepID=UPI003D07CED6
MAGRSNRNDAGVQTDAHTNAPDAAHILDTLPALVGYLDADLKLLYANKTYADLRDIDRSTAIGKSAREVVGPDNYAAIRERLETARAGTPVSFDYDLMARGEKRHVHAQYLPDIAHDGRVRGVLVHVTDINPQTDLRHQAEESQALFDNAFRNSPIGLALVDTSGFILRANRSFADMLGRSVEEVTGIGFGSITHPDDVDADLFLFRQVLAGQRDSYKIDKRYLRPDGSITETNLSVTAMRNEAGEIVRFISQIVDLTEQRQAQRAMSEINAQLAVAMDAVSGGFWHFDIGKSDFRISDGLKTFIVGPGPVPFDLSGYIQRMPADDRAGAGFERLVAGHTDRETAEYRLRTITGERWMRCERKLLRDEDGRPIKIVGVAFDISREREQLRLTQEQAHRDSLTGLLNRRGLDAAFRLVRKDKACGVLAIDLDGFKQVNDSHGHEAGDEVLIETARRLKAAVRDSDLVCRTGGDEFLVVLVDADEALMDAISSRIIELMAARMLLGYAEVNVGCSIGTVWYPGWPEGLKEPLSRADNGLYRAKAAGKNTWRAG